MSDEVQLNLSLQINNGNIQHRSYPTAFKTDVTSGKGPSPGKLTATLEGTDVDLTELDTFGWCEVFNLDETNTIIVGTRVGNRFYPMYDILPGEFHIVELSQFLGESFDTGTGTATVGSGNTLCVKAVSAECSFIVNGFER